MGKKKIQRVSMQHIADEVGVARSTVSFILNGKEKEGRISEEVARRVRLVAQNMNYQINEVARGLRTGYSNTIALVVADVSDVFFGSMAYHIQEYAESKGYALIIINTGEKQERLSSAFKTIINRQIDGVLMIPVVNMKDGALKQLNPEIPMVLIDRYFKSLTTSRVIINNYEVSKTATQCLIEKGCRRIALISFRENLMHIQDRKRGFTEVLSVCHILDESLICEADYRNYNEKVTAFLSETMHRIDGLFIATGGLSSVVIRFLVRMGIRLQSDIQVIGFGRIDAATGVTIPYVRQPLEEICRKSFDILLEQIKSQDNKIVDCVIPATIVTDTL
ncbi:MAG: LacI family transcriptional regulator [Tannerella sp.]|nr:LacI family transcriptional regulator [Tannerella sp.]